MLHLHNDIFLTDITGYDRLNVVKFNHPPPEKNEILQYATDCFTAFIYYDVLEIDGDDDDVTE